MVVSFRQTGEGRRGQRSRSVDRAVIVHSRRKGRKKEDEVAKSQNTSEGRDGRDLEEAKGEIFFYFFPSRRGMCLFLSPFPSLGLVPPLPCHPAVGGAGLDECRGNLQRGILRT